MKDTLTIEEIFQWKRGDFNDYKILLNKIKRCKNKIKRLFEQLYNVQDTLSVLSDDLRDGKILSQRDSEKLEQKYQEEEKLEKDISKYELKLDELLKEMKDKFC